MWVSWVSDKSDSDEDKVGLKSFTDSVLRAKLHTDVYKNLDLHLKALSLLKHIYSLLYISKSDLQCVPRHYPE